MTKLGEMLVQDGIEKGKVEGKEEQAIETAFYYRDSNYIIGIQSVWENSIYAEENKEWVDTD